jgi:hypothetical protein
MSIKTSLQDKLNEMSGEQAVEWIMNNYKGHAEFAVMQFDGGEASSSVSVNNSPTHYQVADFRHCDAAAAKRIGAEQQVNCVIVVGRYWRDERNYSSGASGRWVTSVTKYVRN